MSSKEQTEIQEGIANIPQASLEELVEQIDDASARRLTDLLHKRELQTLDNSLTPLPTFASEEFQCFDDRPNAKVTEHVKQVRKRRYVAFIYYYRNVELTDDQVIQFIKLYEPTLSYTQAVRELSKVKHVMGNMPRVRKELVRYQVIEMHKRAFQKAEEAGDVKGMTAASNGIAMAANLDKDDPEIPWEEMISPAWEPVNDLTALGEGFEDKENLEDKIEKFKKKYGDAEDAEVVE